MKKGINFGIVVILLLLFSGCWAPKSIMTTANITQPMLVGKVKTIGGKPIENSSLQVDTQFTATLENSIFIYSAVFAYGSRRVTQGSNLLDNQLLLLSDETTEMIVAEQIRFKAMSGYWLFVLYSANKGWIDGAKYNYISNEPK